MILKKSLIVETNDNEKKKNPLRKCNRRYLQNFNSFSNLRNFFLIRRSGLKRNRKKRNELLYFGPLVQCK